MVLELSKDALWDAMGAKLNASNELCPMETASVASSAINLEKDKPALCFLGRHTAWWFKRQALDPSSAAYHLADLVQVSHLSVL